MEVLNVGDTRVGNSLVEAEELLVKKIFKKLEEPIEEFLDYKSLFQNTLSVLKNPAYQYFGMVEEAGIKKYR